jgi:hypothetical protein
MRIPLVLTQVKQIREAILGNFLTENVNFSARIKSFMLKIENGNICLWRVGQKENKTKIIKSPWISDDSISLVLQDEDTITTLSDNYEIDKEYNYKYYPYPQFHWRATDSDSCCKLLFARAHLKHIFVTYFKDGRGWLARPNGYLSKYVPSSVPKSLSKEKILLNFPISWEFDFEEKAEEILRESVLDQFVEKISGKHILCLLS